MAPRSADFPFWVKEVVRFADLDVMGHVNNKAYTVYAESGRAAFLRESGLWTAGGQRQNMIVRLEMDYLRELHYPADIRVGVLVAGVGRTSFKLGVGIFHGDACVAAAITVLVRIDVKTRSPVELDAEERAILARYAVKAAA